MLLPQSLDDYVTEDNPVRVVDVLIDEFGLGALGFAGVQLPVTGGEPIDVKRCAPQGLRLIHRFDQPPAAQTGQPSTP